MSARPRPSEVPAATAPPSTAPSGRGQSGGDRPGKDRSPTSESGTRLRGLAAEPRTAAEQIVDALVSAGADTFFGIPGGPIIPIFDAILTHPAARLIESRHETGACFAAMGFHRATGRLPVVVTTAGPGATNVVTGIACASLERVPMLVVTGDVPWASTGRLLLQDSGEHGIAIERMVTSITRRTVRVMRGSSAAAQTLAAVEAATDPREPGPALVVVPLDHAGARESCAQLEVAPRQRPVARAPSADAVGLIATQLREARAPLLVIGAGCREFAPELSRLVDALEIPFVTTPRAKGLVSERHPGSLRTCGMSASQWARRYMKAGADVTVAIGTDLDDVSTAGTPPIGHGGWLAHVDHRAEVIGRNFPTALGLVCDGAAFAPALARHFERDGPLRRGANRCARARAESAFDTECFRRDARTPIAPHRAIADLEAAAPSNARFVTDIGEHMLFALHYLTADSPDRFLIHLGLGSMGSGIGSAIGLALGDPTRPVVCIAGDGGMQMGGAELLVAVEHRLPILYAVFNDARYNMVFHGYRMTFEREAQWSAPPINFVDWARSLGARGHRVNAPSEIGSELFDSLADGPMVLDIRQDASIRIEGDGRVEAIRQMSLLHASSRAPDESERGSG